MFKKIHVFRVKPGKELASEIASYCRQKKITSGIIIGMIGSIERIKISYIKELPAKYETEEYMGPLELVCGQGSVALKGTELIVHVHVQIASQKESHGGHLTEAKIFSTAEVVLGELDYQIQKYADSYTGLNELKD